jgi:uncharacterized membrane protein YdjX (TVP38/TMEM64 family)
MTMKRKWIGAAVALSLAGGLFLLSEEASSAARRLIDRVASAGPWAFLMYVIAVTISVLILLPGGLLPMGGGFLFGVSQGTLLFVLGEMLGAMAAFGLARHFLGNRVRRFFRKHARLEVLQASLTGEGWRLIAMTRILPFFPFKLSNWFFGSMGVRFRDFFWGTLLGTLPLSFLLVYLGSLTAEVASLGEGGTFRRPGTLAFMIASGLGGLAGLAWLSRRVGRDYRTRLQEGTEREGCNAEPPRKVSA